MTNTIVDALQFAATPVFAVMALLTVLGGANAICGISLFHSWEGMAPMYLLMSVFHASPWLRWLAERKRAAA